LTAYKKANIINRAFSCGLRKAGQTIDFGGFIKKPGGIQMGGTGYI